jgi:hypothetical protein
LAVAVLALEAAAALAAALGQAHTYPLSVRQPHRLPSPLAHHQPAWAAD